MTDSIAKVIEEMRRDAAEQATVEEWANRLAALDGWRPIETCPQNVPVILANFTEMCLLSGSPHTWSSQRVTRWGDADGNQVTGPDMWCEASHAATNENGEPTHWMPLPTPPKETP